MRTARAARAALLVRVALPGIPGRPRLGSDADSESGAAVAAQPPLLRRRRRRFRVVRARARASPRPGQRVCVAASVCARTRLRRAAPGAGAEARRRRARARLGPGAPPFVRAHCVRQSEQLTTKGAAHLVRVNKESDGRHGQVRSVPERAMPARVPCRARPARAPPNARGTRAGRRCAESDSESALQVEPKQGPDFFVDPLSGTPGPALCRPIASPTRPALAPCPEPRHPVTPRASRTVTAPGALVPVRYPRACRGGQ